MLPEMTRSGSVCFVGGGASSHRGSVLGPAPVCLVAAAGSSAHPRLILCGVISARVLATELPFLGAQTSHFFPQKFYNLLNTRSTLVILA